MSFPRARGVERTVTEVVGGDAVMLMVDTMEYHTLSHGSYPIWLAADGELSELEIAERVYGDQSDASVTLVQVGLAEAGLLAPVEG